MGPDASAKVKVLTLLLYDQSPKSFLIFFERVLGDRYMEYNFVIYPGALTHQTRVANRY